jgi:hypothetical protein
LSVVKEYQFYSKEAIEDKAHQVLIQMQAANFPPQWPWVADRIVDFLELRLLWSSIPCDEGGLIVAKIEPLDRRITLNQDVPALKQKDRGFEQSTIAHEIGHWVLHIHQDEADGVVQQLALPLEIEVAEQPFLCRNASDQIYENCTKTQDDWREWQAQYFASCLLMPRYKLEEVRKGRNLTNWRHLYAIRDEFGVTISNLTNRLQDLGWIYVPKGSKQIYPGKAAPKGQTKLF